MMHFNMISTCIPFIKQVEILREMIVAAVLYIQNAGASLRMKPVNMDAMIKCGPTKATLNQTCGCHNGLSHPRRETAKMKEV